VLWSHKPPFERRADRRASNIGLSDSEQAACEGSLPCKRRVRGGCAGRWSQAVEHVPSVWRRTAYGDRAPARRLGVMAALLARSAHEIDGAINSHSDTCRKRKQAETPSSLQEPREEVCVTSSEAERTPECMEQEMRIVRASRSVTYQRALSKPRGE
jgi:hypothetical protein